MLMLKIRLYLIGVMLLLSGCSSDSSSSEDLKYYTCITDKGEGVGYQPSNNFNATKFDIEFKNFDIAINIPAKRIVSYDVLFLNIASSQRCVLLYEDNHIINCVSNNGSAFSFNEKTKFFYYAHIYNTDQRQDGLFVAYGNCAEYQPKRK